MDKKYTKSIIIFIIYDAGEASTSMEQFYIYNPQYNSTGSVLYTVQISTLSEIEIKLFVLALLIQISNMYPRSIRYLLMKHTKEL